MKTSWQYSKHQTNYKVEFDLELKSIRYSYVYQSTNQKYQSTYSIEDFLTGISSNIPLKIETKLMALVLQHIEEERLNENQMHHYRFWKYLDRTKLPQAIRFKTIKIHEHWPDHFLELTPFGICHIHTKYDGTELSQNAQRLDHLFFQGPKEPLDLEHRLKIKELLLAALAPKAAFSTKDLFPLFDYTKIPIKRYEYSKDGGHSGHWWSLESNHVSIGGWGRGGRDGGGHHTSIEAAWPKLNGLSGEFDKYRAEVMVFLKTAIISEH
ncbi:MAG: hypothetical protein GY810_13065 [Aureispira sp.]|nr:hypothetical protein [Aureispira sp.]